MERCGRGRKLHQQTRYYIKFFLIRCFSIKVLRNRVRAELSFPVRLIERLDTIDFYLGRNYVIGFNYYGLEGRCESLLSLSAFAVFGISTGKKENTHRQNSDGSISRIYEKQVCFAPLWR